jgi:NitT/TauT family transport system substrate-binding protein
MSRRGRWPDDNNQQEETMTNFKASLRIAALALVGALLTAPASAADKVKMSVFQANLCCLSVYVAQHLKLFEKHGVEVELVYATGIQVTNVMISGSAEFGSFAIEHGIAVASKGQDVKLIVVNQQFPPLALIARNQTPTPNAGKPYPEMVRDLKGLKVGISSAGASTDTILQYLAREAGLDPKKDMNIIPTGDTNTMLAALKNGVIDAAMAVDPTQTAAVRGLKIAKMMVDIQDGGVPLFREYAYNGVWARSATLKDKAQAAKGIVAGLVEAEQIINDPKRIDDVLATGAAFLRGTDPGLFRAYIEKYRRNFTPVASQKGIENVNKLLLAGNLIAQAVPYDKIVAQELMPKEFSH